MPTYALFGATGGTGFAIIRVLLAEPPKNLTLSCFVRSKSKLLAEFPDLEGTATPFKVSIIEGSLNDIATVQRVLDSAEVVFACIGGNGSHPGQSMIQDATNSILTALKARRKQQGPAYKTPAFLLLRSIPLNPMMKGHAPWYLMWCLQYAYDDQQAAAEMLFQSKKDVPELLDYIIVDPPAMHDSKGTVRTGHKLIVSEADGKCSPNVGYADLGGAFVELAEKRKDFVGKEVAVSATGHVNAEWGTSMMNLVNGAWRRVLG